MANFPKYVMRRSSDSKFYWVLFSVNAEILITSETYNSKQGCADGVQSSRMNLNDSNFHRKTSQRSEPYFTQVATNGEPIGTSEMYSSNQARENGIAAVKRDAPKASVEDAT